MFSNMTVLNFYSNCAEHSANIYQDLKKKGLLIESEDLLIAATALGNNINLATGNTKPFDRVVGFKLVVDNLS
ncbi:MAG: type II toxin-antitoxin system VapC family toxin [Methylobacter sp.]|nr:type II toxin-antitoxin system VapC family toxin [Methylobacter sp.]